jgi:hypothetical protein
MRIYQCYDCGREMTADELVRVDECVSSWTYGRGGGGSTTIRVNVCPECDAARDAALNRSLTCWCVVGGVALLTSVLLLTLFTAMVLAMRPPALFP